MKNLNLLLIAGLFCLLTLSSFAEPKDQEHCASCKPAKSKTLSERVSKMEKCLKEIGAPSKAGSPYTSKTQKPSTKQSQTCAVCK